MQVLSIHLRHTWVNCYEGNQISVLDRDLLPEWQYCRNCGKSRTLAPYFVCPRTVDVGTAEESKWIGEDRLPGRSPEPPRFIAPEDAPFGSAIWVQSVLLPKVRGTAFVHSASLSLLAAFGILTLGAIQGSLIMLHEALNAAANVR